MHVVVISVDVVGFVVVGVVCVVGCVGGVSVVGIVSVVGGVWCCWCCFLFFVAGTRRMDGMQIGCFGKHRAHTVADLEANEPG